MNTALEILKKRINELNEELWIDAIRIEKKWPPVIIPDIINIERAITKLTGCEPFSCCKDITNKNCECNKFIEKRTK